MPTMPGQGHHYCRLHRQYIAGVIFLMCLTHITLQENEKSAAGEPNAGRISEIIKVPCYDMLCV